VFLDDSSQVAGFLGEEQIFLQEDKYHMGSTSGGKTNIWEKKEPPGKNEYPF
jgi:hypothetical protein